MKINEGPHAHKSWIKQSLRHSSINLNSFKETSKSSFQGQDHGICHLATWQQELFVRPSPLELVCTDWNVTN